MKKMFKVIFALLVSVMLFTSVKAATFDNLTVTVEGIDLNSTSPTANVKIKLTAGTANLDGYTAILTPTNPGTNPTISIANLNGNNAAVSDTIANSGTIDKDTYFKVAERNETVYVGVYECNTGVGQCTSVSNITSINSSEALNLPITKRMTSFVQNGNIQVNINDIDSKYTDSRKTVHYKIGLLPSGIALKDLEENKKSAYEALLAAAKSDSSPIDNGDLTYDVTAFSKESNLSKSSFLDGKYYYFYAYRVQDGKYLELEYVDVKQYHDFGNTVFLYSPGSSNFSWDDVDVPNPDTPTPTDPEPTTPSTPTPKVEFEDSKFFCEKNSTVETYVISNSEVTLSSDKPTIATITKNDTGDKCPADTEGCVEVIINCLDTGDAVVTAKVSDKVKATKNVEVVEDVDVEYTLTYDSNGGSSCSTNTLKLFKGQKVGEMCKPTKKGYKFVGWFTDVKDGNQVKVTTLMYSDLKVYARWELDENPGTGVMIPIVGILVLAVTSITTFVILTKKSKMF